MKTSAEGAHLQVVGAQPHMRVFLTGATGFVGAPVVRDLVQQGHEVHALVLPGDDEDRLVAARLGDAAASVRLVRGDLLAPASYASALEALRPEACVHLGWYANPKDYLSSRVNLDLLAASNALGARLVDLGCPRIVFAGSCFEYDTQVGYLAETSPLAPRHLYSSCKKALFDVMTQLTSGTASRFVWPRLFFLYGPHEARGRLVPAVVDALLAGEEARVTTGTQIRDFLHVADAAAAIVKLALHDTIAGPVNVGSGRPVEVRQIVQTIARLLGQENKVAWGAIQARPNDPSFVCANATKLASTGFEVKFDLEAGLRDTIEWTRTQRSRR